MLKYLWCEDCSTGSSQKKENLLQLKNRLKEDTKTLTSVHPASQERSVKHVFKFKSSNITKINML